MTNSILDVVSTLGAAVLLVGVLHPNAPNWEKGIMGALANIIAAISIAWPVTRLWIGALQ